MPVSGYKSYVCLPLCDDRRDYCGWTKARHVCYVAPLLASSLLAVEIESGVPEGMLWGL